MAWCWWYGVSDHGRAGGELLEAGGSVLALIVWQGVDWSHVQVFVTSLAGVLFRFVPLL